MQLNKHYELAGRHSFLAPSNYHWVNYDDEKLDATWRNSQNARRGDRLHQLGHDLIQLGVKLPPNKKTLNLFVNDAIGYRMTPEQPLYYSENCFGTADALSFRAGLLRIHDLKTGSTRTNMKQLEIYAALFCLEYGFKPFEIEIELRIYKSDNIEIHIPEMTDIVYIMDKIVTFDKRIKDMRTIEEA